MALSKCMDEFTARLLARPCIGQEDTWTDSVLPSLTDKLDEILAAAQQTISTSEGQGPRPHGGKRDKNRGIYSNEVQRTSYSDPVWFVQGRDSQSPDCSLDEDRTAN